MGDGKAGEVTMVDVRKRLTNVIGALGVFASEAVDRAVTEGEQRSARFMVDGDGEE